VIRRAVAPFVAAVAVLAGCGGDTSSGGATASLWITRDEGAEVLLVREVPAGLTAMQALDRETDVETRYGGRFVQAIDGVEGSLEEQRDWFWFVNGYEADRSAAEYRLRPGDVEWWDFRSWRGRERVPLAVGAFPEPFLHGFDGKRRPSIVQYDHSRLEPLARRLGKLIHAKKVLPFRSNFPQPGANILFLMFDGPVRFRLSEDPSVERPGDQVVVELSAVLAERLARDPAAFRFRYEVG
jgi:hypothetical protein